MYRKIWCMKWIMEHIVIIKRGKFVNKKNLSFFCFFLYGQLNHNPNPFENIKHYYLQKKNIRHYWKTSFYMHVLAYTPKNCKCTNDFMITCVFTFSATQLQNTQIKKISDNLKHSIQKHIDGLYHRRKIFLRPECYSYRLLTM